MFALGAVPVLYRWIAIGIAAALFGLWCFTKGAEYERHKCEVYQAKVEAQAAIAREKAQITRKQDRKNVADLRASYLAAVKRLRAIESGGGGVPNPGAAPGGTHEVPAGDGVPASGPDREVQELQTIVKACALQAMALQKYVTDMIETFKKKD